MFVAGTNRTKQAGLMTSVDRGRPEAASWEANRSN